MGDWSNLRKSNAGKLSEQNIRDKATEKMKAKNVVEGSVKDGLPPAGVKEKLPLKKVATKADIKAYHDAVDATSHKSTRQQEMLAYKKVLGYYDKDKSCIRGKPNPAEAVAQLAEIKARYASTGGEMLCQQFFTKATDIVENLLHGFNALEMLQLRRGFSNELTKMLALDPGFYEPELTEMRIETGKFESEWQLRLLAKWFGHWKAWSAGQLQEQETAEKPVVVV